MALKVNQQAPDFTLFSTEHKTVSLEKDLAGKPCILYFYPRDFTPGCTAEACGFRDHFSFFHGLDITIYGISHDDIGTHHAFREAHQLPFHLLSDPGRKVAALYKAVMPVLGRTKRTTYLLDPAHRISAVYESLLGARQHLKVMIGQVKAM